MSAKTIICKSRDEWLQKRKGTIGGSDAGCALGLNPWKDNVTLWRELTGRSIPEDISDKPVVKYGIEAEPHIRALFGLDYPQYFVWYEENNIIFNDHFERCHFSADGLLIEGEKRGVLEIKTSTVSSSIAAQKWKGNNLPPSYYVQVLFGMMITDSDFAYLRALLHFPKEGQPDYITIKDYYIERSEVQEDMEYLAKKIGEFVACLENDVEPPRILPEL